MYKQILIPDKKNHSIILPEDLYGKKIEVTVIEIFDTLSKEEKIKDQCFLDDIQPIQDFPGIDEIRKDGWPNRW
ncbi:hypothetical protein [Mucilaginibacter paludis]|uniref:Uncharacterized protein n=1 Tax=Mucilaginibacter paludis DSM 18603 TaxID=714943 RepID=H1YG57_9SPHI|nr:hypothetical protein [Mucilaginibacter paludis]EHQ27321.1 hypothetical protein Mucpa_3217 [Mucilaginibacter paludis DSM 18603]